MDSGDPIDSKQFCGQHLVAVPFPGRGHINPLINICNLLAAKGFLVTIVVTEEWLSFISSGGTLPSPAPNVSLRSIPNVIPSEQVRGADFSCFIEAVFTKMETPIEQLLDELKLPVSIIIADTLLPWMIGIGKRRNIPVACLWTMSPTMLTIFWHVDHLKANGHFLIDWSEMEEDRIEHIPGISSIRLADLPTLPDTNEGGKVQNRMLEAVTSLRNAQCLLLTSFYELETKVIDSLRAQLPFPVCPIGPSIPLSSLQQALPSKSNDDAHTDYLGWLDSQPESSVLFVSMGSIFSVSAAQMDEIAAGLHASGVRYVWVARGEALRLQEMAGEMGLVLLWCEQLRVLCHPSVGGFLTHCGWNSTLEAVYAGVPMLTFPICVDQPTNSKLIVEDWQVGERARSKVGSLVERGEIAKAVGRFMDLNGEESKERRRRAKELKEACRRALENGGSSYVNLDAFAKYFLLGGE